MKQHIRRFGGQARAVPLDRLDHRFNGFLAEFLGAFLRPLGQQPRGPRSVGIRVLAGLDRGGQDLQGTGLMGAHVNLMGMPAAAMWALA